MKKFASFRLLLTPVLFVFLASACITTRAQLRRDGSQEESDPGVKTKVTEVSVDPSAIDDLRSELVRLSGRLEELERTNQTLSQQNSGKTEEVKKLETRIQELESAQLQLLENLKKKEKEKESPAEDPVPVFERGKTLHREKDFAGAIEAFSDYLKFKKGRFEEEALFLRAESFYSQNQHRKAILDYSSLQERFPRSKKMPKVLFKIGMSFEAMGEKSDAKIFFQELVDKFPRSPEAKKVASKPL